MTEMFYSTEKLVRALQAAQDPRLTEIIERARGDYYHDLASPLIDPNGELVADLQAAGRDDLARRALSGDFDVTQAEAVQWARDEQGQQTAAGPPVAPLPGNRATRRGNTVQPQQGR